MSNSPAATPVVAFPTSASFHAADTTSFPTALVNDDLSNDSSPPRGTVPSTSSSNLLNYYFLLLAVVVILFFLAYYMISRRRKQKLAHQRSTGQNALARDLEGWAGARRWAGGRWRGGGRDEIEGLDERGEAPPPYMPKVPERAVIGDGGEHGIPLRGLGEQRKPPDYQETATPR